MRSVRQNIVYLSRVNRVEYSVLLRKPKVCFKDPELWRRAIEDNEMRVKKIFPPHDSCVLCQYIPIALGGAHNHKPNKNFFVYIFRCIHRLVINRSIVKYAGEIH